MKRLKHILRWLALPIGLILILMGAITLPLPIPTGLVLIAAGIAIAALNPLTLRWIKRTRRRYPGANRRLRDVAPRLPAFLQRILARTDSRLS